MHQQRLMLTILGMFEIVSLNGCTTAMNNNHVGRSRPQAPAQLERLNMLQGRWRGTGEVRLGGRHEAMALTGNWVADWDLEGWYFVTRDDYELEGVGRRQGLGIWTWDPKHKRYRTWWFDQGTTGAGTVSYDEAARAWHFRSKGKGGKGSTVGRGVVRMPDDNTMEWSWIERPAWDILRLFKTAEMRGRYERVSKEESSRP